MNLQVISAPDGEILWVSGPLPGAVHDLTAARIWGVLRELAAHARFDGRGTGNGPQHAEPRQSPTLLDVIFMGFGFLAAGSGISGPGIGGDGARRASAAGSARSYAGEGGGSEQFRGARFGEVDLCGARTHNSPDPRWLHADHA